MDITAAEKIESEIRRLLQVKRPVLVAIDGRCAAGKTTLGEELRELCGCGVVHMDHFFLRPQQRTEERLNTPGGNVDRERFLQEVLLPLSRGKAISYRPYDCRLQALKEAVQVAPGPVTVIEGAYACHPSLREYYDLKVFLTVEREEQLRRIRRRNGSEAAVQFQERWIPLEERYFAACGVEDCCDLRFETYDGK
ncbi:AAA family ATPase [Oscillibacter sp.]|uniref:uridine kinase family protein n=1 Tax=Oscillibacter sp. TaxID=1945593 RepID=UPI00289C8E43|nr:AAA family ATPase [Oscillibacter sp.]